MNEMRPRLSSGQRLDFRGSHETCQGSQCCDGIIKYRNIKYILITCALIAIHPVHKVAGDSFEEKSKEMYDGNSWTTITRPDNKFPSYLPTDEIKVQGVVINSQGDLPKTLEIDVTLFNGIGRVAFSSNCAVQRVGPGKGSFSVSIYPQKQEKDGSTYWVSVEPVFYDPAAREIKSPGRIQDAKFNPGQDLQPIFIGPTDKQKPKTAPNPPCLASRKQTR